MKMEYLSFEVKTGENAETGTFTGYASTFGNKDLQGDVMLKGAFTETLATYGESGAGIPIHWEHSSETPMMIIGSTLSAVEDEKGLLIEGKIDLDTDTGKRAYQLLQDGRIHQMSIGYVPEETAWVKSDEDGIFGGHRELRKVKLFEISIVQMAANQSAEILEVKSGRAISKANEEKLRSVHTIISEILKGLDTEADPTPEDDPEPEKDEGKKPGDSKSLETIKKAREILAGITITEKE